MIQCAGWWKGIKSKKNITTREYIFKPISKGVNHNMQMIKLSGYRRRNARFNSLLCCAFWVNSEKLWLNIPSTVLWLCFSQNFLELTQEKRRVRSSTVVQLMYHYCICTIQKRTWPQHCIYICRSGCRGEGGKGMEPKGRYILVRYP